jgi:hypothetical protein
MKYDKMKNDKMKHDKMEHGKMVEGYSQGRRRRRESWLRTRE